MFAHDLSALVNNMNITYVDIILSTALFSFKVASLLCLWFDTHIDCEDNIRTELYILRYIISIYVVTR